MLYIFEYEQELKQKQYDELAERVDSKKGIGGGSNKVSDSEFTRRMEERRNRRS